MQLKNDPIRSNHPHFDHTLRYLSYLGIMNTCGAIPGFIGTYISGAILESTGNWSLMYAVTGWVCITGWAVFGYFGSGESIV